MYGEAPCRVSVDTGTVELRVGASSFSVGVERLGVLENRVLWEVQFTADFGSQDKVHEFSFHATIDLVRYLSALGVEGS